jgi:hypothetical protein
MNQADEREAIAAFLYDESRIERYRTAGYTPMWHELEGVEQGDWMRKAARLQEHLKVLRRAHRSAARV